MKVNNNKNKKKVLGVPVSFVCETFVSMLPLYVILKKAFQVIYQNSIASNKYV